MIIDFIKGIIAILITVFLVSCATVPQAQVPTLPSDDTLLEQLVDEPANEKDLLHNNIVFEYLYVNQKLQTYNLMQYIAKLADDMKSYNAYGEKISEIKNVYNLT